MDAYPWAPIAVQASDERTLQRDSLSPGDFMERLAGLAVRTVGDLLELSQLRPVSESCLTLAIFTHIIQSCCVKLAELYAFTLFGIWYSTDLTVYSFSGF